MDSRFRHTLTHTNTQTHTYRTIITRPNTSAAMAGHQVLNGSAFSKRDNNLSIFFCFVYYFLFVRIFAVVAVLPRRWLYKYVKAGVKQKQKKTWNKMWKKNVKCVHVSTLCYCVTKSWCYNYTYIHLHIHVYMSMCVYIYCFNSQWFKPVRRTRHIGNTRTYEHIYIQTHIY